MSDYDELAARAERGELTVKPGTIRRGGAAQEAGRRALMDATGTGSIQEAARVALGRPALGNEGRSPVIRARVPQALKDRVTTLAEQQHRRESEVIRDAVAAYVEARSAS